jgi:hypothetical protein
MTAWIRAAVAWLLLSVLPLQSIAVAALAHCGHPQGARPAAAQAAASHHHHDHHAHGGHAAEAATVVGHHHPAGPDHVTLPDPGVAAGSGGAGAEGLGATASGPDDPSGSRCSACAGCCLGSVPGAAPALRVPPVHPSPGTAAAELAVDSRVDVPLRPPRST